MVALNVLTQNAFEVNKDKYLLLLDKQYLFEDIENESKFTLKLARYYAAIYYCKLIYQYIFVETNVDGVTSYTEDTSIDWKTDYDYTTTKECLACSDINLDLLLDEFGITY